MSTAIYIPKSNLNLNAELSQREFEICEQVILGHTQIEVSSVFYRSYFTIANTLRNAFNKVGARNIMELGVWYWCKKLGATIDFTNPKRTIITMSFLLLFVAYELTGSHETIRSLRVRGSSSGMSARAGRSRRNESRDYLFDA